MTHVFLVITDDGQWVNIISLMWCCCHFDLSLFVRINLHTTYILIVCWRYDNNGVMWKRGWWNVCSQTIRRSWFFFLGVQVLQTENKIFMDQCYMVNLLKNNGPENLKPCGTFILEWKSDWRWITISTCYRITMILNYATVIAYVVNKLSQFMLCPKDSFGKPWSGYFDIFQYLPK